MTDESSLPPTDDAPVEAHALRALELIRLNLEGQRDEARLLFETVPGKDYLGLASAAVAAAAAICEDAGREFCLAIIDILKEAMSDG